MKTTIYAEEALIKRVKTTRECQIALNNEKQKAKSKEKTTLKKEMALKEANEKGFDTVEDYKKSIAKLKKVLINKKTNAIHNPKNNPKNNSNRPTLFKLTVHSNRLQDFSMFIEKEILDLPNISNFHKIATSICNQIYLKTAKVKSKLWEYDGVNLDKSMYLGHAYMLADNEDEYIDAHSDIFSERIKELTKPVQTVYKLTRITKLVNTFVPEYYTKKSVKTPLGKSKLIDLFKIDNDNKEMYSNKLIPEKDLMAIKSYDKILLDAGLLVQYTKPTSIIKEYEYDGKTHTRFNMLPADIELVKSDNLIEINLRDYLTDKELAKFDLWIKFNNLTEPQQADMMLKILVPEKDETGTFIKVPLGKMRAIINYNINIIGGYKTDKELSPYVKWRINIDTNLHKYGLKLQKDAKFDERVYSDLTSMKKATERKEFLKTRGKNLIEIDASCCMLTILWEEFCKHHPTHKVINSWDCFTQDPVLKKAFKIIGNKLFNDFTKVYNIANGLTCQYSKSWGVDRILYFKVIDTFITVLGQDFFNWINSLYQNTVKQNPKTGAFEVKPDVVYKIYTRPESLIMNWVWEQVDGIRLHDAIWVDRDDVTKAFELLNLRKQELGYHNLSFKINY